MHECINMHCNEEKLDGLLLELGFDDFVRGTDYLWRAVRRFDRREKLTALYAELGKAEGCTGAAYERTIRHAKEKALGRGNIHAWTRVFGWTLDPYSGGLTNGGLTNGELIARLARLCRED